MADTLDEIFAAMPEEAAAAGYEYLTIDPDTLQIDVPESEALFGVENDTQAETKHFICPRYVGNGVDLLGCFVRINYRNANGEVGAYLVEDMAATGDYVTFSWTFTRKVTQYRGAVQFLVCACYPFTTGTMGTEWHTALATGTVLEGMEPDAAAAEAATADVIAQLLAVVERQTAAVQAEGTAQITAVQAAAATATDEANDAIQAQGAATLASIPADYAALSAAADMLERTKAPAIVCAAEGTAIQVTDASDDPLRGLRIFGRSTQDGTPTPEAPVEIVSTPAPVVTVCGKNLVSCQDVELDVTDYYYHTIYTNFEPVIGETYTLSMTMDCSVLPYHINIGCGAKSYNSDLSPKVGATYEENGRISISFVWALTAEQIEAGYTKLAFRVPRFATVTTFKATVSDIMLERGASATAFEPYTEQTMAVTSVDNLPGIPVASGGNYTDADGQQWICDEVDFSRGVYVQRIFRYTYTGAESWMKHGNTNDEAFVSYCGVRVPKVTNYTKSLCDRFAYSAKLGVNTFLIHPESSGNGTFHIAVPVELLTGATMEAFKSWLAENPTTLYAAMAEPVETDLSDVELAAFAALRSNKPTTTLLNDAGAYMAAEYNADTRAYIDRKIAELIAANK